MAHHCGAGKLMGSFVRSPLPRERFHCEWRTRASAYKRHQKRALAQFRRRDGKRFILEGLAVLYEEQARMEADYESSLLDAQWDDNDDDDCSCCRPETCGCPSPEEHDYWADRDAYDHEAEYQAAQAQFDWGWEVHQEYLNGVRDGYLEAIRDMGQNWAGVAS